MSMSVSVPRPSANAVTVESLRSRIIEIFGFYPKMSPTMLQAALGASLSPDLWKPILHNMIEEGMISQYAAFPPRGSKRTRPYTILQVMEPADISSIKVPPRPIS